jgi:threonine aldolase
MRQAGVIAAPGIVALETMVTRLADDHANARRLAEGLARFDALAVDLAAVETNMVMVDLRGTGLDSTAMVALLRRHGVVASNRPPHHIRLVTNRHHDATVIDEAIRRIGTALAQRT